MDIQRLYDDFNVGYVTEGHHHARNGWINVKCPFCTGHEGFHLGFSLEENYWICYRCGWHPPVKTVAAILSVSLPDAAIILKKYGNIPFTTNKAVKRQEKPLILPTGVVPLTEPHKQYLNNRGFDADVLEKKWGLQSTGVLSKVENISYKHRIFIPYNWNSQLVTFDTRIACDNTDSTINKYQACPVDREIMHRKSILYGNQEAWQGTGICVEGCSDVWRFGDLAFATSGISFTPAQVRLIAQIFKHVFIAYDTRSDTSKELQAQVQARKLRGELRFRGVKTEIVDIGRGDPGSMSQVEADKFVKNLLG